MNCKESKISLPHSRLQNILCWQLTCTNTVFQYMTTIRDAYSTASMLYPLGNVFCPVQIEAQQDISHVKQMYLSTSMFDNAAIFRGSFPSLRVDYRHTNGVLLLWKKKDTSHVSLRLHPKDMSQLIASHWSAILFWNNDGKFLQITVTTLLKRTPTSTLHRVFHSSLTTIKMMTTILNLLAHHRHDHIHQMFLCQMILTRRIPAFLLMMMILFTHHFNHHHGQMMTLQMRKCIHHKMNLQTYPVSIITTRSSTTTVSRSPCHTCCTRHRYCAQ